MVKRFRIGLNFFFDNKSNSGIVNYIYNIVAALNTLNDDEKPVIIIFYSENAPVDYLKSINYPYVEYVLFKNYSSNFLIKKTNSLFLKIFKRDIYKEIKYFKKIDCLYPYFEFMDVAFASYKNKIHWLVDFNNKAFPGHYENNGEAMNNFQKKITSTKEKIVLSSNALFEELKKYYPDFSCDVKILRFASSLEKLNGTDASPVIKKYNINTPYFMSPNQLWEHKNQGIVLDAVHIINLQKPELKFKVLFSGSLDVNRGKGLYIEKLKAKVKDYKLENFVSFLGVLDRKEQLLLMKNSVALLQPSLYEGWSTLVEEAKALNKFIILSDLPVHKEQINLNVAFFDPYNATQLAETMIAQLENTSSVLPVDYSENIRAFGKNIMHAFTS